MSSYQINIDLQRCAAPNKTADYQKIYSDWCHEFHKYKTALKTWEENKEKCGGPAPPAQQRVQFCLQFKPTNLIHSDFLYIYYVQIPLCHSFYKSTIPVNATY